MTASTARIPQERDGSKAELQTVIPGTELASTLIRLANFQPRVPTRNPNTVKGSRQRPVEDFRLTHDPLTLEPL